MNHRKRVVVLVAIAIIAIVAAAFPVRVPGVGAGAIHAKRPAALGNVRYIWHGLKVRPPRKRPVKGKVKMALYAAYGLATAVNQKATITFKDGTTLHMNARTDITLKPSSTVVKNGEVDQTLQPGSTHNVETASAVGAAVGTEFDTKVIKKTTTIFIVLEGALLVKNQFGNVLVKTGEMSTVKKGQAPGPAVPVPPGQTPGWSNSLPKPAVSLGINLGLDLNGGTVLGVSSDTGPGSKWSPLYINDGSLDHGWSTAAGKTSNAWVTIGLAGQVPHTLLGIVIDVAGTQGHGPEDDARDFEILVSTTGTTDSDFTSVLSATAKKQDGLQRFPFAKPVQARYVKIIVKNNNGGQYTDVAELLIVGEGDYTQLTPTATTPTTPTPTETPSPVLTQTPIQSSCNTEFECQMALLGLINEERARWGEKPLVFNPIQSSGHPPCAGSKGHTEAMVPSGNVWHVVPGDNLDSPTNPASFPNSLCGRHGPLGLPGDPSVPVAPLIHYGEDVGAFGGGQDELENIRLLVQAWFSEMPNTPQTCAAAQSTNHLCEAINPAYLTAGIWIQVAPYLGIDPGVWVTVDFLDGNTP